MQSRRLFCVSLAFRPYAAVVALSLLLLRALPSGRSHASGHRSRRGAVRSSLQADARDRRATIDIRLQRQCRATRKPAGIYWLQALAVAVARSAGAALDDIWAYQHPLISRRSRRGASDLLGGPAQSSAANPPSSQQRFSRRLSCFHSRSRIAKSDAALMAGIALSQGALFRLSVAPPGSSRPDGLAALFWFGLGAGILIKGPVAPGLALLTSVDRSRRQRRAAPGSGTCTGDGASRCSLSSRFPGSSQSASFRTVTFSRQSVAQDFRREAASPA